MKTLILILLALSILLLLFFKITDFLCDYKDCKLRRFWNKYLVDFMDKDRVIPMKFHNIKMVTLKGKIRVFSLYGNWLCDIHEEAVIDWKLSIDQIARFERFEINYVKENYLLVYNTLKEIENGNI